MKKNESNLFEELTEDFNIPSLVNAIYDYGTSYLNDLDKMKDFIRYVGNTFKCPDMNKKND